MSYFSRGSAFKSKWNFKQIRLELGQLTGTAQTVGIHEIRYIGFRIAVRTGMQVQHELDQRAVQPRERTAHHRTARTGDFRSGLAVEQAELRAAIDVSLGREVELRRRAPTAHRDVVVLVPALWHGGVWDIRHAQQDAVELVLQRVEARLTLHESPAAPGPPRPP